MAMNTSDTGEMQRETGSLVQHVVYRVPKKNHDAMLHLCKEANDIRENGGLRHDVFQLSKTDVPMQGFTNVANIVSADQDEEVWMELLYFRDRQHMNEVMSKMQRMKAWVDFSNSHWIWSLREPGSSWGSSVESGSR
jgi:uncharacterized protein YbaA (DUF1428 family)